MRSFSRYISIGYPLILLCGLVFISCQAPHDNPFDPESPAYHPAQPPARIIDLSLDSLVGLSCKLTWTSPENAHEYMLFSGLPGWNGRDTTGAEQYQGDMPGVKPIGLSQSIWINLPPGETRAWILYGISEAGLLSEGSNPVVIAAPMRDKVAEITVAAKSIHHASWGSLPYFALEINATINDSDGVDRVWIKFRDVEIGSLLPVDDQNWRGHFPESNLNGFRLGEFIGHPFTLHHLDSAHFVGISEPFHLARVIYDVPVTISPDNFELLDTNRPVLEWEFYETDFSYNYKVEIWHVPEETSEGVLVYQFENISSEFNTHPVDQLLPTEPQYLFWTITVIDEFGNEARSLTASFRILEDD